MPTQEVEKKRLEPAPLMEFPCGSCHLIQRYRGPSHLKCIYCGSPVNHGIFKTRKDKGYSGKLHNRRTVKSES